MGTLEQIKEMKKKGMSDEDIISNLRQQGVSPRDVNDALNQSQIKNAVEGGYPSQTNNMEQSEGEYPEAPNPSGQMSKSQDVEDYYEPQQQNQQQNYSQEEPEEEYSPQEGNQYSGYGEYDSGYSATNADTLIEVAEQVFLEKSKEMQRQIEELMEFKSMEQLRLDHFTERLKRIEAGFDKLQIAILDKVGSYGHTLESIRKEMSMMQNSFGKALPGFPKKHATHSKPAHKKITKKPVKRKSRK